nr:cytochrome P450 [Tanacetum cinerariifolium]
MSKGKKIKVEDKEVGEKKRKKDPEPSSSEDEKPLKKKTKRRKERVQRFMEDIGFFALHLVNIDTLPKRLARFVVRAFDNKTYNFYLKTGVVHVTAEKIICEMIEEKLSSIPKEKAEVETLLRDANKEFPNDDNVKQLFEKYKGFFKETVLLEEAKAHKAPQNVKLKPAVVNTKEAAKKPKPAENVKELAEKPKEPAEKAQKAPQNVKPNPAAVKTKEAAKKHNLCRFCKNCFNCPFHCSILIRYNHCRLLFVSSHA